MHIEEEQAKTLEKLFKEKYKKDLMGDNLCQFHFDFTSNKLKGYLYSKELIVLGKKAYYDRICDSLGNEEEHYRLKGISKSFIEYYCNLEEISIREMYNGETITFDLRCGGKVLKLKMKNFIVNVTFDFKRKIMFF